MRQLRRLRGLLRDSYGSLRTAVTQRTVRKGPQDVQTYFLFRAAEFPQSVDPIGSCNHLKISALVLSNNGAQLMENLLNSLLRYESCRNFELVISLQDSQDGSEKTLAQFNALLDLKVLQPGQNLSFSEGVNRLAGLASGEFFLLLNNDFEFSRAVMCESVEHLTDETVGVCGIPLIDARGHWNQNGINFSFDASSGGIRPTNVASERPSGVTESVSSVTGAFLVTRASDFKKLGGLDEDFFFGFEDVDYCLRVIKTLKKRVLLLGELEGRHPDQTSRNLMPDRVKRESRISNFDVFQEKHGMFLRKATRGASAPLLEPQKTSLVISATTDALDGRYGDSVVAQFLKERLKHHDIEVSVRSWTRYPRPPAPSRSYCLHLVPKSLQTTNLYASFGTTALAWVRQWSRVWADDYRFLANNWVGFSGPSFESNLDQLGFSSRRKHLPLGTDPGLHPLKSLGGIRDIDYLWPANYFKVRRAPQDLSPIPGKKGIAFGNGWAKKDLPAFELIGAIHPHELSTFYARAKVVVDDSGENTLPEGSVNLRFWEALAGGALPLSNNRKGIEAIFPFDVPTWDNPDELSQAIGYWCERDGLREELVSRMRKHTPPGKALENAAKAILQMTRTLNEMTRICVLNPAPEKDESHWGDTFLAWEFANLLQDHDFVTRVLPKERWNSVGRLEAEAVIVLHGRERAEIRRGQLNILWIISNPERLDATYARAFDEVWIASERGKQILARDFGIMAKVMIVGASKPFEMGGEKLSFEERNPNPLFIGNSLGRVRPSVLALTTAGIKVEVIGQGWERSVPGPKILGTSISRIEAGREYQNRRVVVSDTREAMKDWGILPPRVWEAIRAGAVPISDFVEDSGRILGKIPQWKNPEELVMLTRKYAFDKGSWEKKGRLLRASVTEEYCLEKSSEFAAKRIRLLLNTIAANTKPAGQSRAEG